MLKPLGPAAVLALLASRFPNAAAPCIPHGRCRRQLRTSRQLYRVDKDASCRRSIRVDDSEVVSYSLLPAAYCLPLMEFNRNQFFMIGVLLVLLGVQFRLLESATLNEKTTQFLAAHMATSATGMMAVMPGSMGHKVIQPPQWLGWALMSIGAVCILHSLAMKKPGG
jgi:hypothetical protein